MNKKILYSVVSLVFILFVVVVSFVCFGNKKSSDKVKEEVPVKVEKPFITEYSIEEVSDEEVKEIFLNNHAMALGDSMGEGLDAYKVLYSESVVYTRGRRIDNMVKDMPKVIEYNPKYLFLSYGANDIIKWNGDVEGFINAYKNSISYIKEVLPDTIIIINSVLPVSEKAINNKSAFTYQSEFNSKLMELCKSMEIDFLENSRFLLLHFLRIQIQGLLLVRGNGADLHGNGVRHIQLGIFPGNVIRFAALSGHFIHQRDALGLRRDQHIEFRRLFQQLLCRSDRDFHIPENHESRDAHMLVKTAERQIPFESRNGHGVYPFLLSHDGDSSSSQGKFIFSSPPASCAAPWTGSSCADGYFPV